MLFTSASLIRPLPIAVGEPHPGAIDFDPRPMPVDFDGGIGSTPGFLPRIQFVFGDAADNTLVLQPGGFAFGGGGNDTFVLTSGGGAEGSERLGMITDFDDGDMLDLGRLGPKAQVLGREQPAGLWGGPDRISIDYDGDGREDGHLLVSSGRPPAGFDTVRPMPMPSPGDFHILPFPIGGPVGGDVHILPFPGPGDLPAPAMPELRLRGPVGEDGVLTIDPVNAFSLAAVGAGFDDWLV